MTSLQLLMDSVAESNLPTSGPQFLRLTEVSKKVGLTRSTIYKSMNEGNFPKSIKLGARSVAWLASDVDGWMQQRTNEECG
jgi:prophage regulatory protein